MEPSFQPWWSRILEKQGIATVFALLLLGGGWKIAEAHLDFIKQQNAQMVQQTQQMQLQTRILSTIASSNTKQEMRLEELHHAVKDIPRPQ